MPSIYDIYEFYLEPKDLKDKAHVVIVQSVKREEVPNPRTHKKEGRIVVRFEKARKTMIMNKTQAGAMAEIAGTDDYTKWVGTEVVLVAGVAVNGKNTIVVTNRANSGDIDLMYPKDKTTAPAQTQSVAVVRPSNIPKEWWDARSDQAVEYAMGQWKLAKALAWAKIDAAIKAEALSEFLPVHEFKEYVEMPR
jgi:signal recognition particle subunit SEC65